MPVIGMAPNPLTFIVAEDVLFNAGLIRSLMPTFRLSIAGVKLATIEFAVPDADAYNNLLV